MCIYDLIIAPTDNWLCTLSPDNAIDVLEELLPAQNQSYVLGLKLKLPLHVVDAIHSTQSQPHNRLLEVLIAFMKQVEPMPTWKSIADVLRSPAVNLPHLALKIDGKWSLQDASGIDGQIINSIEWSLELTQ